jgi:hypothetical protein
MKSEEDETRVQIDEVSWFKIKRCIMENQI